MLIFALILLSAPVVKTAAGVPVRFEYQGRTWHVAADPVGSYEWIDWWREFKGYPRENPPGIDLGVWRVQARLGRRGELVTFDLMRDQDRAAWLIRLYAAPNAA
jgi:hypothetical protein